MRVKHADGRWTVQAGALAGLAIALTAASGCGNAANPPAASSIGCVPGTIPGPNDTRVLSGEWRIDDGKTTPYTIVLTAVGRVSQMTLADGTELIPDGMARPVAGVSVTALAGISLDSFGGVHFGLHMSVASGGVQRVVGDVSSCCIGQLDAGGDLITLLCDDTVDGRTSERWSRIGGSEAP